jgi:hemoglobin
MTDGEVYTRIGDDGFARLVAAFYRRVPADSILGPMYAGSDLAAAEWRLREFLVGRFGGPMRYVEARGHPRLRMRHAPFTVDAEGAKRWVALMSEALDETQLPADVEAVLRPYFISTALAMINHGG